MSVLRRIRPDYVLASVLDRSITVHDSATKTHVIRAYKYGKQPNKGLGDEFLIVHQNGAVTSRTRPLGCFTGNLAIEIRVRLQTDNTTRDNVIDEIMGQVEDAANDTLHDGFMFRIEADNVIVPTAPNLSVGYSTTVINVEWRTTDKFNTNN